MASLEQAPRRLRVLVSELERLPNGKQLGEYAVALDRWMRDWATYAGRKDLPDQERNRAVWVLTSMRRDFNALVAEARAVARGSEAASRDLGTALDGLDSISIHAIGQALGLPFDLRYRALFEVKAVEYVEQDELWDDISNRAGFGPVNEVQPEEARSIVVLTYTGSLLLLSPPYEKRIRRKYIYQSIYANNLPAEGNLALLNPILRHGPVRATRFTTSAVRKLAVSTEQRWDEHRETFVRLHRTLGSALTPNGLALRELLPQVAKAPPARESKPDAGAPLARPPAPPPPPLPQPAPSQPRDRALQSGNTIVSGTPLAASAARGEGAPHDVPPARASQPDSLGFRPSFSHEPVPPKLPPAREPSLPSVFVQVLHRERQRSQAKEQEAAARAELRALLGRLVESAGERDHALEAEILGQVMHLQRFAADRGELVLEPSSMSKLETENDDFCTVQRGGLNIGRLGGPGAFVKGASFAGQIIVRGAPVAVLAADASLYAVLGNVRSWSSH